MGRTVVLVAILQCLIFGSGTASHVFGDEPAKPVPSPAEIEHWIEQLSVPEFAKREEATKLLIAAGTAAVKPLVEASESSNLETTVRITTILRSWFTSDRDELFELAEAALEQLSQSKNRHMAGRAVAVLDQYADTIRQERALAQIKKLGGLIRPMKTIETMRQRRIGLDDDGKFYVTLGLGWQGGTEGLKYVRRLQSLTTLFVARNRKTGKFLAPGITIEALDELKKAMPQLAIAYRGPALLGIQGGLVAGLCVVEDIKKESPAANAKLQPGDVIAKFNGNPVGDFESLVDFISEKQPGDVIKLEILRGEQDDLLALARLQAVKDPPDSAKEVLNELRKRLSKEVQVTLSEWE